MRKKTLLLGALSMLLVSTLCAQDITGDWQGTLKEGSQEVRVVFQIARAEGRGWKGSSYAIDYSPDPSLLSGAKFVFGEKSASDGRG